MTTKIVIYEEVLRAIAGRDGPLTGEDALCFKEWARVALDKYTSQQGSRVDQATVCDRCGSDDITWVEYECNQCNG